MRYLFAVLSVFLLSACAPVTTGSDAISLRLTAKALNQQASAMDNEAQAQIRKTADAQQAIMFSANATGTAQAALDAAVASSATQVAIAAEVDENNLHVSQTARADMRTQQAEDVLATQAADVQILELAAKQEKLSAEIEAAKRETEYQKLKIQKETEWLEAKANFWQQVVSVLPSCLLLLFGLGVLFAAYIVYQKIIRPLDWQQWHNMYVSTPDGTMIVDGSGRWVPLLPREPLKLLTPPRYTVNGEEKKTNPMTEPQRFTVAEALPTDEIELNKKLIAFIIACQVYQSKIERGGDGEGWRSKVIPRWENLEGYNSDPWKLLTDELKRRGMVKKVSVGQGDTPGTYVLEPYENLHGVFTALRKGAPPLPHLEMANFSGNGTAQHMQAQEAQADYDD